MVPAAWEWRSCKATPKEVKLLQAIQKDKLDAPYVQRDAVFFALRERPEFGIGWVWSIPIGAIGFGLLGLANYLWDGK